MNVALPTAKHDPHPTSSTSRPGPGPRALDRLGIALFALLAYVPVLATRPGRVVADTKSYLTLDPGQFLSHVGSLWDPHIGMGTVSHQTVGYLFPMGPFYWVLQEVFGLPGWVTQRLWLGTLIFAAGMGVRYLLRTLDVRGPGVAVGVLAYAFTPYVLQYSSRLSVLLSPWAGLPWMLAFVILGLRSRHWKYAALLAITVQLTGTVNLPALLYVLIGPILWVPYAVWIRRDSDWRRAWALIWRTFLLTVATSLWWAMGLVVQGKYGLSVLRFTESIESVSATSTVTEILRGLGYWFFYGSDKRGYWNEAVLDFNRQPLMIVVSFAIPLLAVTGAALIRWRDRAYFLVMALIAVTIAVAASPYHDPTVLGSVVKSLSTGSSAGLALRSTSRAVPLLVLSFALLLAVAVSAAAEALRRWGRPQLGAALALALCVLCIVGSPGVWHGRYYSKYLERPQAVPAYWTQAAKALDATSHDTRVLGLPGADFAAYRWGDTIDPIEPGIMKRDYVARELVPWGSEASANLLIALDRRLQGAVLDPDAVAPIARLMGAGDVLLRNDLETDRFALLPSRALWKIFTHRPPVGLGPPQNFGTKIPGNLKFPDLGDLTKPATPEPAPVSVFTVKDPVPIVRSKAASNPLVVDGDGEGLVDLASAGLLDAKRLVLYSASFEGKPAKLRAATGTDGLLLVTDSNRRRGMRWASMNNNYGYTEQAGEKPLAPDLLDQRLELFPDSTDASKTVTELSGIRSARATTYGTPSFGFSPDARPTAAMDGRLLSAWEVASGLSKVGPETLRITLDSPITSDRIHIVQPFGRNRGRWITKVRMRFDGGHEIVRVLPSSSRTRKGADVGIPRRTFTRLEIQIAGTDANKVGKGHTEKARLRKTGVGFAEIVIRDAVHPSRVTRAVETIRMPRDLLAGLGTASVDHPLALVMTRNEPELRRSFTLPTARSFTVSGTMQLSPNTTDDRIDARLGIPDARAGGITAQYGRNTPVGDPTARAFAAVDGDPATAFQTRAAHVHGDSIKVTLPAPVTIDHLNLQVRADGRHSLPTQVRIDTGTATRTVDLPAVATRAPGDLATVPITFAPVTTDHLRFTITKIRPVRHRSVDYGTYVTLPVALAELGIPNVTVPAVPVKLPTACIDDLLSIDGTPFPIRLTGTTADALDSKPIPFTACDPTTSLRLGPGVHHLYGKMNDTTGLDFGRAVLSSAAGGAAATPAQVLDTPRPAPASPKTTVLDRGDTAMKVRITDATAPAWLVLGQSFNAGWHATLDGHDLGPSTLVDGYANGWRIDPRGHRGPLVVSLEWQPQQAMRLAFVVSATGMLVCLGILVGAAFVGPGCIARRRRRLATGDVDEADAAAAPEPAAPFAPPTLIHPFRTGGHTPSTRAIAITSIAAGVVAGVLSRPWTAIPVAIVVALALVSPRGRGVLRLIPAAFVLVILGWVSSGQFRHNYPASFDWPVFFERLRTGAWLVIILLAADGVVGLVRGADRAADDPTLADVSAPDPEPVAQR